MSVSGGGNLYPNWLGSAALVIPNNQVVVNGKTVNVVPSVIDLVNHGVASVTANTKTLVYTVPGTFAAGVYLINAEFQTQNTAGGSTVYAIGDSVDWVIQGIGDTSPDYAEVIYKPYYCCGPVTSGATTTQGVCKQAPSGVTAITNDGTQIGVYVTYNTGTAGTITAAQTITTLTIQKIA